MGNKEQHMLYVIGGVARGGKSATARRVREKRLFITPSPEELCRPIVRYLFANEIPNAAAQMLFEGSTTYGPVDARQQKAFDFAVPIAASIATTKSEDLLVELPTDYIRAIIRSIFVGENRGLSAMGFTGKTSFISSSGDAISNLQIKVPIQGEDSIAWRATSGILADYDIENRNDVLIEGVAITPEEIDALRFKNLKKKVVFVGLNKESHAEVLLTYLQNEAERQNDYLFHEMRNSGKSDEQFVKDWMRDTVDASNTLRARVEKFGYQYFDATERSFHDHVETVTNFLL